jgi:hypothetical protein
MEFDDLAAAVPAVGQGEAGILSIDVPPAAEGRASRPEITSLFAPSLGADVRAIARQSVEAMRSHLDERGEEPLEWEPGGPLPVGQIGLIRGAARAFHEQVLQRPNRRDHDELNRAQHTPPPDHARAIAFTVLNQSADSGAVDEEAPTPLTVIRRRDPMRQFGRAKTQGILASWTGAGLQRTSYVFAYDGGWDVIAFGDDFYVRDRTAFEAIFGDAGRGEARWLAAKTILGQVLAEGDVDRLGGHAYAKERLKDVRVDLGDYLRTAEVQARVEQLALDDVWLSGEGRLSFGTSPAAVAQAVMVLEDGFVDSVITHATYSADVKQPWPPRRLVLRGDWSGDSCTHLLGDGWRASVEEVADEINGRVNRYAIEIDGNLRKIQVSRAKGNRGQLWVADPSTTGSKNNVLLWKELRERSGRQD